MSSSAANPQHEPTMEEILASIRKIISEDQPEAAKAASASPPTPLRSVASELASCSFSGYRRRVVRLGRPRPDGRGSRRRQGGETPGQAGRAGAIAAAQGGFGCPTARRVAAPVPVRAAGWWCTARAWDRTVADVLDEILLGTTARAVSALAGAGDPPLPRGSVLARRYRGRPTADPLQHPVDDLVDCPVAAVGAGAVQIPVRTGVTPSRTPRSAASHVGARRLGQRWNPLGMSHSWAPTAANSIRLRGR